MKRHVETVRKWIEEHRLLSDGSSVLVGLSGGLDSIVLAEVLDRLEFAVHVLHVNYRLRGEESDADEAFVRAWCLERGMPLEVRHADTADEAALEGESIQEAARRIRYRAFADGASAAGIPAVAVGHHRDDQVETVLINLFRGTGPEGLGGMRAHRALFRGGEIRLVRPLLPLWRREIEEYAREGGLSWREDATNLSPAYRRGALRMHVFPVIEKYFGDSAKANVARTADLTRAYVDTELRAILEAAFSVAAAGASEEGALDVSVLRSIDGVLRRWVILEGIRRWLPALGGSSATVAEIEKLLEAQVGRRLVHPSGEVWRERTRLVFRASAEPPLAPPPPSAGEPPLAAPPPSAASPPSGAEPPFRLEAGSPVQTAIGVVSMEVDVGRPENIASGSPNLEYVDADRMPSPVFVRPWRAGDRFVPLGMQHEKKVSDFLTDVKVAARRKRDVHVVQAGDDIVWVVGHRIAEKVRVRPGTKRLAELRFRPGENSSSESA